MGHTAVLDNGSQQFIVGMGGWEIINRYDNWIYAKGVNMGGYLKSGRLLKLVDARGGVENHLDGKRYLVTVRQDFFIQI